MHFQNFEALYVYCTAYLCNLFYSVEQLKDIGAKWVILGHSERRHIIGEVNEVKH